MSHSSNVLRSLTHSVIQTRDHSVLLLEDSTEDDQSNSTSESSSFDPQNDVSLQDLFNSPEFIEEQKLIMLEIETARLRIENNRETPPRRRSSSIDCPRRSSIGIKFSCPVCLESFGSARCSHVKMVTECGHMFCQDCIENVCEAAAKAVDGKTVNEEPLCPVCRKDVGELRRVYF